MTLCHGSLKFLTSRGRGNFPHPCGKHMGAGTAARFERVSGPNLLTNDTRSLGQGPLAALAVVGAGNASLRLRWMMRAGPLAALALDVNSTTEPAAEQAGFAPHDLVS
jgi:hypothetical protein